MVLAVLRGHEDDPGPSALALRLMGAVHRLVLQGGAPELAAHYPSAGGAPHHPWPAFLATLRDHAAQLRRWVELPVQTNEPARCAALLGGFLEVARSTKLPLRLLEVGTSAGLNLRFDRYRYELGAAGSWGPARSPVTIAARVAGAPPLATRVEVAARAGCDVRPVDPTTDEGRLTLASYVWPDQLERLERLRAACEVAASVPASVDAARAADWVEEQLAHAPAGQATVVFHSIVMQYLDDDERQRFEAALRAAGARADTHAPLGWLRMEPGGDATEVRLAVWPAGDDRLLATAAYHGDPVEWLG